MSFSGRINLPTEPKGMIVPGVGAVTVRINPDPTSFRTLIVSQRQRAGAFELKVEYAAQFNAHMGLALMRSHHGVTTLPEEFDSKIVRQIFGLVETDPEFWGHILRSAAVRFADNLEISLEDLLSQAAALRKPASSGGLLVDEAALALTKVDNRLASFADIWTPMASRLRDFAEMIQDLSGREVMGAWSEIAVEFKTQSDARRQAAGAQLMRKR